MDFIYLSPHLDDAALSCGGLVWQQILDKKQVEVWTLFAGDSPTNKLSRLAKKTHKKWNTKPGTMQARRQEDIRSLNILGAGVRHFEYPDCIYRRDPRSGKAFYSSGSDVFGEVDPREEYLTEHIAQILSELLPPKVTLMVPLVIGNHVDHQLTRAAAERLPQPRQYYLELPYILKYNIEKLQRAPANYHLSRRSISGQALTKWQESIAAYQSQIRSYWLDLEAMRAEICNYCDQAEGGIWIYEAD